MTGPEHEELRRLVEVLTSLRDLGRELVAAEARRDALNARICAIPFGERLARARPLSIEVAEAIGEVCALERRIAALVASEGGTQAVIAALREAERRAFGLTQEAA